MARSDSDVAIPVGRHARMRAKDREIATGATSAPAQCRKGFQYRARNGLAMTGAQRTQAPMFTVTTAACTPPFPSVTT